MIIIAAVITAAGRSRRMGAAGKKEYLEIEGTPVLARSILPFLKTEAVRPVVVTVPEGQVRKIEELLRHYLDIDELRLIVGGVSRQESVYKALEALLKDTPEAVLIHDGARPWVTEALIKRVLDNALKYGACIPVVPVAEAPKLVAHSGFILKDLDREQTAVAQTPQGFNFGQILEAHRAAQKAGLSVIDDAEAYSAFIGPVFTVAGEVNNRKITFRQDLN